MESRKIAIMVLCLLVFQGYRVLDGERSYTFGDLWGGDITLSPFPWGIKNLQANISVYANETIVVRIYSNGDVTLTLKAGKNSNRKVLGNNESLELVISEDIQNITLSLVNTNDYPVTIFGNSTIRIIPPEEEPKPTPIISENEARLYGMLAVVVPIAIMLYRSKKRRIKPSGEELIEYMGAG